MDNRRRHALVGGIPMCIAEVLESARLSRRGLFGAGTVVAMSTGNFVERALSGLRPDVLIAGATGGTNQVYKYTERLIGVLGMPPLVLPTHWDNFEAPLTMPQPLSAGVQRLVAEVGQMSPQSEVKVLNLLESYAP
jgi:hypothetical protein